MRQQPINFDAVFDRYGQSLRGNPGVDPIYNAVNQAQLDTIPPDVFIREPITTDRSHINLYLTSPQILSGGIYKRRRSNTIFPVSSQRLYTPDFPDTSFREQSDSMRLRANDATARQKIEMASVSHNKPRFIKYGIQEFIMPPVRVADAESDYDPINTPMHDYLMHYYSRDTGRSDLGSRPPRFHELRSPAGASSGYVQRLGTHHQEPYTYL